MSTSNSPTLPNHSRFSPEDASLIRATWKMANVATAGGDCIGKKIVMTLIQQKPKYGGYFGVPDGASIETIGNFGSVIAQANRIQQFLNSVVGGLKPDDDNMALMQLAKHIGTIHFYRGVDFDADMWLLFKNISVAELNKYSYSSQSVDLPSTTNGSVGNLTPRSIQRRFRRMSSDSSFSDTARLILDRQTAGQRVWTKLLSMVIREMKRGFLEETLRHYGPQRKTETH